MAQRGDQTKPNRFKGPLAITLRGAGSSGNDPLKVGCGLDVGLYIEVPAVATVNGDTVGQSVNCLQISQPSGTVKFQIDQNMNIAQSGVLASVQFVAQVALTAAQLIAMYTTPVAIVLAQLAGIGIVVDQVLFQMKATATPFTGGGIVTFQYGVTAHGAGTSVHGGSLPASVVTATGPSSVLTLLSPTAAANGVTVPSDGTTASGIYVSNASAPFAAGTGTGIVTVYGSYVTLG